MFSIEYTEYSICNFEYDMICMPLANGCIRRFEIGIPVMPTRQNAIQHNTAASLRHSAIYLSFPGIFESFQSNPHALLQSSSILCPHQTIEQRPRQNEPSQSTAQPTRPQLQGPAKVPARVEQGFPRGHGLGGDADGIEEDGGQQGEDDVEEEAVVGLEAKNAGCDAEEGGCEGLEV